jgi:hypothetical protein
VKCIQKHALPSQGFGMLSLSFGAKVVAVGYEGGQLFAYVDGQPWGGSYVAMDVQVVREGESFPDSMEFIGMASVPGEPGLTVFVMGKVSG